MNKKPKPRRNYRNWWLITILFIILVSIAVAIIRYRSSLEAPEPEVSAKISIGQSIRLLDLHICLPSTDTSEFTWITERVIPERIDRSALMKRSIMIWGQGMLDMIDATRGFGHILKHCFIDDSGVAYIDFSAEFMDAFPLSTTTEMQLLASLYQTVQSNVPSVRRIEVLREGTPVNTWGGHLLIDQSRIPLLD